MKTLSAAKPGSGLLTWPGFRAVLLSVALLTATGQLSSLAQADQPDLGNALNRAQELAKCHRYQEVLELLTPLTEAARDPEAVHALHAEIGRAHFHLGEYEQAHAALLRAVAASPQRVEAALYLQAASYVTGRKEQAMTILSEILASGARDLYLAMSLPGERAFLTDPRVWTILQAHTVPIEIDIQDGRFRGAMLGQQRDAVARTFGVGTGDSASPVTLARAGPKTIWAFGFGADGTLDEIIVHAEHLLKYTPYRLHFDNGLDWRITPAVAIATLGPPARSSDHAENGLALSWSLPTHTLTLEFGPPAPPWPPPISEGTSMLLMIRLRLGASQSSETDSSPVSETHSDPPRP
jgi:tetratricopeptide (TPR) repeat protein